MIEFLASIEPASIPLLAVLAFSLSLYPLGFMLGAPCSPCCDTPCEECETGKLPDTVTLTFDGYPDVGPLFDALFVSLESCYGSGATATAATNEGAITAVTVTEGGSGYAKLARVEPTITAAGPGGSGADITVTLSEEADVCSLPYWTISALTVVDGGSGYTDGDAIVFTLGEGETEQSAAFALIQTSRAEPELTIEPPEDSGTGAEFTVSMTAFDTDPETWFIASITVDDGGTGYTDGQTATVGLGSGDVEQSPANLTIINERNEPELTLTGEADLTVNVASLAGSPPLWEIASITVTDGGTGYSDGQFLSVTLGLSDVESSAASLQIKTVRSEPTLTASTSTGDGAVFTITVTKTGSSPDIWSAASVSVTNPGSGYTNGGSWTIAASAGTTIASGLATATVNESGGLVSLAIDYGGQFFFDTGVIESVDVLDGGAYFLDSGIIDSISINSAGVYYKLLGDIESISLVDGGAFYAEDPDGPPHVADVTVSLSEIPPSDGAGATFTVNVNDDPDSPTFGQIVSVTVDDGGSGYAATGAYNSFCMGEYMNGREFVLARRKFVPNYQPGNPTQLACQYITFLCDPLSDGSAYGGATIEFQYRYDTSTEPGVSLVTGPNVTLTTEQQIADCSDFELEFPADSGAFGGQDINFNNVTATVVSGGGSVGEAIDENLLEMAVNPFSPFDPESSLIGVCGSCCLNEEPTPVEVTVSIENLAEDPVTGSLPDGDYVMIRDPFYEYVYPDLGNLTATIWRAAALFVIIEPCATLVNSGGAAANAYVDAGCGDTCYKKCRLRILLAPFNDFINTQAEYDPGCDGCVDGPMCSPPAGSYTLLGNFPEIPYYTATIA